MGALLRGKCVFLHGAGQVKRDNIASDSYRMGKAPATFEISRNEKLAFAAQVRELRVISDSMNCDIHWPL